MQPADLEISPVWWRFSRYEVKEISPLASGKKLPDGAVPWFRYIRPAPGATLERYERTIGLQPEEYQRKTRMGSRIGDHYQALLQLNVDDEIAILDWCSSNGLLGLLPHKALSVRLAPRWRPPFGDKGPNPPVLFATQTQYSRTHVGWAGVNFSSLKGEGVKHLEIDEVHRLEDNLNAIVGSEDTRLSSGAVLTELYGDRIQECTLREVLSRYFSEVNHEALDTYEYPMPLSDEFWNQYGESIGEFRWAVLGLRSILDRLGQAGPLESLPTAVAQDIGRARTELHTLLAVSPAVGVEMDGTFVPRWAFPSLLSILAFDIRQDLVGGQFIRHCKRQRCRKLFLTSQYNREYCSDRCRQAEEKARQRRPR